MKACPECGQPTSFWQRTFGGSLCSSCAKKAVEQEAARERAAEQQRLRAASEARERRLARRRRCTVCGSEVLKEGYVPDSGGNWMTGGNRMRFKTDVFEANQLQALACMSCGHVSFWIFVDELPPIG